MWAGSFQNWNICPETWWRWLPPCFRLPWDWGLQKGMGTLLRLELQHPSPSPQRQEHLSALNHPPFHSQHTAPLCFIHIGSTLQWHPFTVNMLNTSYSVPSPWFKLFPRFLLRFGRPNPLLSLHLITWWLSYIWASLKHLLPVNYLLCELHGVQNPDHIGWSTYWMYGGEKGGMDRAQSETAPSSQPSAFSPTMLTCCQAWAMRRLPLTSRPPQCWQKDVLVGYYSCVQQWRVRKEKASVALQSPREPSPSQAHVFACTSSLLKGHFTKKTSWVSWKLPRYAVTSLFSLSLDFWFSISSINHL